MNPQDHPALAELMSDHELVADWLCGKHRKSAEAVLARHVANSEQLCLEFFNDHQREIERLENGRVLREQEEP